VRTRAPSISASFIQWRFYFVVGFILLIVAGLLARLIDLTVFKSIFLRSEGNARVMRVVQTPAFRGMITDRDGHPLAISAAVYSIWVNPKEFMLSEEHLKQLTQLLHINKSHFKTQLAQYKKKNREFMYVKRDVSPELAAKLKLLNWPGLYQQQEY